MGAKLRRCCTPTPSRGESSHPAGESREGAALFGGGLGEPPNPFRSASRQGSGRMSGEGTGAQPCAPTNLGTGPEIVTFICPIRYADTTVLTMSDKKLVRVLARAASKVYEPRSVEAAMNNPYSTSSSLSRESRPTSMTLSPGSITVPPSGLTASSPDCLTIASTWAPVAV